jgi:uncharacterized membrane protein
MKKPFSSWLTYVIISILVAACSKSNEVAQMQKSANGTTIASCDTANMQFSTNVLPILQANCYSCHGNGRTENGVSLDGYENVKKQADNGKLIGTITHAAGYPPMPNNLPKLSDCDINKITDWMDRGAINN